MKIPEPAWRHLRTVYDLFDCILDSSVTAKSLKKFITHRVILNLFIVFKFFNMFCIVISYLNLMIPRRGKL